MYRATTPFHTFTLPKDTSLYSEIQVTYKHKNNKLVKHYQDGILPPGMTLDGKDIIIRLTQQETLDFAEGDAHAQVRVMTQNGDVMASQKFLINITACYSEDILE